MTPRTESLTRNLPTVLRTFTPLELWLTLSYLADELGIRPELECRGAGVVLYEAMAFMDPLITRARLEGQNRPQNGERQKATS